MNGRVGGSSRNRAGEAAGRGLFLAFEGVEGSGKSTQSGLLAQRLRSVGHEVVLAREPGSTPLGERIRHLVLDESGIAVPPGSELFLMLAARAAFVDQVVVPALEEDRIVIADRFELSTLAYQGAGRGIPTEEIARCNRLATRGVTPDLTILLELPAGEGVRRQIAAGKKPDRVEAEARDFHERVAHGYARFADRVEGLVRIDARGTVSEVRERIEAALTARFPETFGQSGFIS